MEYCSALGAGLLFALACNLDTALAAVGQGARGGKLQVGKALLIALATSLVTLLSLTLGTAGGELLPTGLSDQLGGLALTGLGLWYILEALRGKGEEPLPSEKGWLALSAALGVNNAGVGVAAGVTGAPVFLFSACNFAVTLLSLWAGRLLRERLTRLSALALPVSGILLTLLGLWQILG